MSDLHPLSTDKIPDPVVALESCKSYSPEDVKVAVRNCLKSLGGIEQFVRPGQTVLVKPNLLSPRAPEKAVTTHPMIVQAVIRACQEAGAGRVWFGDSCAGNHADERLWEKTGMTKVAAATGAELRSFTKDIISYPCGKGRVPVPAWFNEVDVIVSVPKLKTHLLTILTGAVKNMYGMVAGEAKSLYHGTHPSPQQMSRLLVDVYRAFTPALTIMDAVQSMQGEGPANGDPVSTELILASSDAVALDAVCTGFLGLETKHMPMLQAAAELKIGTIDINKIHLEGTGIEPARKIRMRHSKGRILHYLPSSVYKLASRMLSYRPVVNQKKCTRCGICQSVCSQKAIYREESGAFVVDSKRCILCMCCMEACPNEAITVHSPLHIIRRLRQKFKSH